MRQKITNKLISIGVPASFKGFTYICDTMEIYAQDESYLHGKTCKLYQKLAEKYKVTPISVERAIRHALTKVDKEKVFPGQPKTNGNLLTLLYLEVKNGK